MSSFRPFAARAVAALVLAFLPVSVVFAQCVSLTTLGSAATQNFDTLSNTPGSTTNVLTITGWFLTETGGGARDNEQYAVDTGASTTGDMYSFGAAAATDRALGELRSGTLIPIFGACYTNNTGATITSLAVAYTGEEWRLGTADMSIDQINFEFSTTATDLVTGTWTGVAALNFPSPDNATVGAKNGNAASDRTALSSTIGSQSIANGATFWIRWTDNDSTGADDGLAVDDFSLTPNGGAPVSNVSINDVTQVEGNAGTSTFAFTVSVVPPLATGDISFNIATADGTAQDDVPATDDNDYVPQSLTGQTILAGVGSYTFNVTVNGDTAVEPNETFFVNLSNITATGPNVPNVSDAQGQGTITNDDSSPVPTLAISDVTLAEGNAGTTTFTFAVTLSAPTGGGVTFDIATADGTAQDDNPATEDNDYVAQALTGQTIPGGSTGPYNFSVTVNGDTVAEANETFFANVTNVTGATIADGQGVGTITNDDVALTPIHDIQGPGAASPIAGSIVTTRGIVTGRKTNGYYIQEPDAGVDADPATSEGVFVFTSSAPPATAAIGNLVQVAGTIVEFVPAADPLQPPLTEIGTPTTTQISTGNAIPTAVPLTATFPNPAGAVDQLERVEGMRVSVASATATSGTGGTVNEPAATSTNNSIFSAVVTGVARPFREPGIQANDPPPPGGGTIPPIPRWDFDPELFQVDFDAIGGAATALNTGAVVTNLVGPLDFGFRRYTVLPEPATPFAVAGGLVPTAVTVPTAREFTVASYNLERFYDDVDDPAFPPANEPVLTNVAFSRRLQKASLGIRNFMRTPDVVGVVEVENLNALQALAAQINADAVAASQPNPLYTARLVEGNDIGGIDVGFLIKQAIVAGSTPRVTINAVVQEKAGELFVNADSSTEFLNDRPSLRLDAVVNNAAGATFPVTVIVNHLRSLNNVDDNSVGSFGWATVGQRVRAKRQKQAESLADIVQLRQAANASERIILVGDFNSFEFNDGLVDMVDVIKGTPVPDNQTAVPGDGVDLVNPDLTLLLDPTPTQRYSFLFGGIAQEIDHAIVNGALIAATTARRVEHPRINADFAGSLRGTAGVERNADHDPLVGYYTVAGFAVADLSITKTDSPDPVNAGANITYTVTVTNNGPDAATTAAWSDVLPAGTTFVSLPAVAGWTCTPPAVGSGGTVTCSNPSFAVGSAVFTLTVAVAPATAAGTVLSNTANTTSTTGDPTPGNNSATATTTVAGSADVSITKVDTPDPVTAGTNVTWTITATNAGPSNAAAVSIGDTLPAGTTFVSLASPGGWSCTTPAVGAGGTVTCTNPSFASGSAVFTLVAAVGAGVANGTVISNTATATSTTTDPVPGNNSATATTTVSSTADLSVTNVDAPDPVAPGGALTYTITVANSGPSSASSVVLADTVPANTTFTSLASPGGWSCTTPPVGGTGAINCTNATVAAGTSVFTLVVAVDAATPAGTVLSDTATVTTTSADSNPGNNSATATTTVSSPATLSATKTASGSRTQGSTLTYTIVLRNTGVAAQNDNPGNELTDVLPAGLVLVSATASSGTVVATTGTNTVTWNGAIAAGGTVTITITATIAAAPGTSVVNQATVSFDGDGNGTNESTVVTDDPGTGAVLDPTGFVVSQPLSVPASSPAGLLLMLALFGFAAWSQRKRFAG